MKFITAILALVFCTSAMPFQSVSGGSATGLHTLATTRKSVDAYLSNWTPGVAVPTGPVEGTPISFNGHLYTLVGVSASGAASGEMRVDSMLWQPPSGTVATPDMQYISAFVHNGVVHVFGSSLDHQRIRLITSTDLVTWTVPVTVHTATAGRGFYNTSVTADAAGGFVMAVETTDPVYPVPFVAHFLRSQNLTTWNMGDGLYNNGVFVNCPTLRYVGGWYYMLYMSWAADAHMTFVARTHDFITWQNGTGYPDGQTVPFVPGKTEGNNLSDVDLVEHDGYVYFLFARGNQTSWLEMSTARFKGTLAQYFQSFYP